MIQTIGKIPRRSHLSASLLEVRLSQKQEEVLLGLRLEMVLDNALVKIFAPVIVENDCASVAKWLFHVGMNFSLAEQKVLLSMLLRRFTWELPEDSINKDGLKIAGGIIIMHAKDMHLKFIKRF
jgi:hypothetical protein